MNAVRTYLEEMGNGKRWLPFVDFEPLGPPEDDLAYLPIEPPDAWSGPMIAYD